MIGGFARPDKLSRFNAATDHLYFPDHATWCVNAAAKTPSWKSIFFIFSNWLWVAVAVVFIAVTLSVYAYVRASSKRRNLFWAVMCTIKISIGFMPGLSPNTCLSKTLFLLFLMYGLIVSTLFQSATVSSMTSQNHRGQISSIAEAADYDFEFAGSNLSRSIFLSRKNEVSFILCSCVVPNTDFFLFFLQFSQKTRNNFRVCRRIDLCVDELKTNSRLLVVAPSKLVRYNPRIDRSKVFCSFESIFQYHYSIQSRSGFHLMPKIDELLLRFNAAGLSSTNWRVFQVYDKGLINTNSSKFTRMRVNALPFDVARYKSTNIMPLNIEHFGGAILILIAGFSSALIAFCLEIIAEKLSKKSSHKLVLLLAYIMNPLEIKVQK